MAFLKNRLLFWKYENQPYTFAAVLYITYQEKQRDFGPAKPWQRIQFVQPYEGAYSNPANSLKR